MNPKQLIVDIIAREVKLARERHIKASVERAAMIASANAWDDYHEGDSLRTLDKNPYDTTNVDRLEINSRNYLDRVTLAYELAISTFLE